MAVVYSDGRLQGLCGDEAFFHHGQTQYAGFGCNLDDGCVYYTLGWENAPWMFINSHTWLERTVEEEQCVQLDPGETIRTVIRVWDQPAKDLLDIHEIVRKVYSLYHQPPRKGEDLRTAVRKLALAVDTDAWMEKEKAYAGFVFDRETHLEYRALPSISWTNGVAVAWPMLLASYRLGNERMRKHALMLIQEVVDHSINPLSGVPWTFCAAGEWSNRGWWYDRLPVPGHSGYLVGQAVYDILRAYDTEKNHGTVHTDWLLFALPVLERLQAARNTDGEYPYVLSEETGAGLCYDSMGGVWCLAAAAYACWLQGHCDAVRSMLKSEKHYYQHYVAKVCCYGGPLDIDKQVDSEGVLAFLRAVRWLHRLTGSEELLDHMRDALLYEFTFKFCCNPPIQAPPLSRGWSSCGGSITSVVNPHIHPMSSSAIDEIMYYLSFRDDSYIRSRLRDTVAWGLQTYARHDREYDYGKTGWMSERFCYSQGLLTERYPDGRPASTWFALMPWAAGSLLEGFCGDLWDASDNSSFQ